MSKYHPTDSGYPPGVTGKNPHFDLPSTDEVRGWRHAACKVCRRGPHPQKKLFANCYCQACKWELR